MKNSAQRQNIIAAARRVLERQGYEAASIKEIAKEAGIASGLIHYYFATKEELLSQVLLTAAERHTEEMRNLTAAQAALPRGDRVHAAVEVRRKRVFEEPSWYELRYQFFAMGMTHTVYRDGVRELLARGRQGIAARLQSILETTAEEAQPLAAVLLAAFDGLALQKLVDPGFDLDAAYRLLEERLARL